MVKVWCILTEATLELNQHHRTLIVGIGINLSTVDFQRPLKSRQSPEQTIDRNQLAPGFGCNHERL